MKKNISLGFFSVSMWCFITAFGYVYTSEAEQNISIALFCVLLFGFSITVFCLLNFKNLRGLFTRCKPHLKSIIIINATTFGSWFLVIYPLRYMEPSVVNTIILGCIPIFTLLINKFTYHQAAKNSQNLWLAISLTLSVAYLIFLNMTENVVYSTVINVLAVSACIIGSFSVALNNIYTKKISNLGVAPLDIMITRFIFTVVTTGIFAIATGEFATGLNANIWYLITTTALVLVIIPQVLFQVSMRELEPFTIGMVLPLMPVLVFMIEFFSKKLHPTLEVFLGILAITCISLVGGVLRYRAEKIFNAARELEFSKA
jgi:drug/metabolite transporter (DMT)-like permease